MVQDLIEDALIAAIIDRGENAERSVIEFIGGHIPRKRSQSPVQEVGVHTRLRLFFPPPPPNSGSWQRGQTPGGRATGASWWDGRAKHLRVPIEPPDQTSGGGIHCP